MIVLMAGLPGTGKSTLAQALSNKLSGAILSKDEIRHALFAPQEVEYSTTQDDFCMEIMLQAAAFLLRKHEERFVFLDGRTFSRNYQIERVIAFANSLGQTWRILECVCSDQSARHRLEQPSQHPAENRDFSLYCRVKSYFEPIDVPKLIVDTDEPLSLYTAKALEFLRS